MSGPKPEAIAGDVEFDPTILPAGHELPHGRIVTNFAQHFLATLEIDGAPIIRVDQAKIPQFAALIEVCYSRRHQLENKLGKAVQGAMECYFCGERPEV